MPSDLVLLRYERSSKGTQTFDDGRVEKFASESVLEVEIDGGQALTIPLGDEAVSNAIDLVLAVQLQEANQIITNLMFETPLADLTIETLSDRPPRTGFTFGEIADASDSVIGFGTFGSAYLLVAQSRTGTWFCDQRLVNEDGPDRLTSGVGDTKADVDDPSDCESSSGPEALRFP